MMAVLHMLHEPCVKHGDLINVVHGTIVGSNMLPLKVANYDADFHDVLELGRKQNASHLPL